MKYILLGLTVVLVLNFGTNTYAQTEVATTATTSSTSATAAVRTWFDKTFTVIETFRIKQAVYFTGMRDQLKVQLKIDGTPQPNIIDIGTAGTDTEKVSQDSNPLDNPFDYGKYIFSISLASLFSHQIIFYISGILLALIFVRFLVSRLV